MANLLYWVKTSETRHVYGAAAGTGAGITPMEQDGPLQGWPTVKPLQNPVQGPQREAPVELEAQTLRDGVGLQHSPISCQLTRARCWNKTAGLCKYSFYIATDVLVLRG